MKYTANPIEVNAYKIVSVGEAADDGTLALALENGENVTATAEMMARFTPGEGDYWVIQPDGYTYLNPAAVFESKYAPTPVADPSV